MIYISSSCIKDKNILKVLKILKNKNIKNIELSGGTENFYNLEKITIDYLKENDIKARIHNYFPPPKEHFVINIASLDNKIFTKSINHCINAITFSKKINSKIFSVHAGFLIDPKPKELGIKEGIKKEYKFFDYDKAVIQMQKGIKILEEEAGSDFKIYIENNVINNRTLSKFGKNPFLLTDKKSYNSLRKEFNFNLLLDLAHLKVSSKTLGYNFNDEANYLFDTTDYLHVSGNDGVEDSNNPIFLDKEVSKILSNNKIKDKTITLEVYDNLENIIKDYHFLKSLIK
tara:strand:+ start:1399 stop:2259 length:861 start_codon:yes stop_codon:yes gene_type:complete